ncbi:hypothetical protein ABEW49_17535 [Bacillus anthracis]|uniref:hypothetical protein n=1 Tax=Bacillus anthracis TaxID=1392 RepID=UPI003D204A94
MKKYILPLSAFLLSVGLVGCTDANNPEQQKAKEEEKQQKEQEKLDKQKAKEEEKQQKEQEKLDKQKEKEEEKQQKEQEKLDKQKAKEEEKQQKEQEKLDKQKAKEEEKQQKEQEKLDKQKGEEQKKKDEFSSYTKNIKGGPFIKDAQLLEKKAEIIYFDSYVSYKSQKPDSNIAEDMYKEYFSTGDAITKMFVSEPARLLRQFPDLDSVKMTLPYDGKTYSIDLNRKELNEYIGFKIEKLKVEDDSWAKKFNTPYVYDKNKRAEFFKKFVTVQ